MSADRDPEQIYEVVLRALLSDDELMERLVLKGGNALNLVYGLRVRATQDLDFSMEGDFSNCEIKDVEASIRRRATEEFWGAGYEVVDVRFTRIPGAVSGLRLREFGGYSIVISYRPRAGEAKTGKTSDIEVEISHHEYCAAKKMKSYSGLKCYVYTLEMLAIEKLRALCQQTPEYAEITGYLSWHPRARDVFDVSIAVEHYALDLTTHDGCRLARLIFWAKRVPLDLLGKIRDLREFHRDDFMQVKTAVSSTFELKDFDTYFDRVVEIAESLLEALRVE